MTTDVDVVIVGAGPVGLVLGIQLAQFGRSVAILEQWPSPYTLPRAVHFDHEVGRIIDACGIGEAVRAISEPAEVYEWRNGDGQTLLRFGRVGVAASGWPFSSMFCQPEFEGLLQQRADELASLEVRRGVAVDRLEPRDDHVVVGFGDGELTARYVVGCDGANSTVRNLLGVDVDDLGFHYDWLIVDLILDEPRVFDPINVQICDPVRPTTAVSGGPGRRRWEFMRLPHERIEDMNDEARAWELLEAWGVHPGNARLERHAVYTFQARTAQQWQVGNVFLAGDAAHLMPPFAGQGMCSGLRDAHNLAWKIDAVLAGHAGPALLATYDEERRPNAMKAIEFSVDLGKVICVADPAEAAARDAAMTAGYDGTVSEAPSLPAIAGGLLSDTPEAGTLLPTAEDGWVLIAPDHAGLDARLIDWFATIGGRIIDGDRFVLRRPDCHVFGTAIDAADADQLLSELQQRLAK